jgi:hypothetical protein
MEYTRRHFANLLQAGAAMAATGFRSDASLLAASDAASSDAVGFSSRHFASLVGSEFRVASHTGGHLSLRLIAVEEMPRRRPAALASAALASAPRVDCALLRFSASGLVPGEGTCRLAHERYGDYDLYLNAGEPGRYLAYICGWRELPR